MVNGFELKREIAKFEYVSNDTRDKVMDIRGIDTIKETALPTRATTASAGYDILTPINIKLNPGESIVVPTFFKM